MGPSGAGKDSILNLARAALQPGEKIAFAHRYITRAPDAHHENYISLSDAEFDSRLAAGLFAFDWQAHGVRYAIGGEIRLWERAGFVVVVSGSREHFATLVPRPANFIPVLITASTDALRERLFKRGDESAASIEERLDRASRYRIDDPGLITVDNSGALKDAGQRFVDVLRQAASAPQPA